MQVSIFSFLHHYMYFYTVVYSFKTLSHYLPLGHIGLGGGQHEGWVDIELEI